MGGFSPAATRTGPVYKWVVDANKADAITAVPPDGSQRKLCQQQQAKHHGLTAPVYSGLRTLKNEANRGKPLGVWSR